MKDDRTTRQAAAAKIKSKPSGYKVCESCGSIVARRAATCPNCNAYRFDICSKSVVAQAEALATRNPLSVEREDYA